MRCVFGDIFRAALATVIDRLAEPVLSMKSLAHLGECNRLSMCWVYELTEFSRTRCARIRWCWFWMILKSKPANSQTA